jgi:hypothetical protein
LRREEGEHISICACMHARESARTHTHTHAYTHMCQHADLRLCVGAYTYITCMNVCTHTYTYLYKTCMYTLKNNVSSYLTRWASQEWCLA